MGWTRRRFRSLSAANLRESSEIVLGFGDAGAVLLEVIVALALLATAGLAAVSMAAEAAGAVSRASTAEVEMRQAARLMDAVSLWPRADLDRRMGDRRQGPFILRIARPADELYTAALADSATRRVLLATSLFRQDTADAQP
jgi:hypothetical protein